MGIAKMTVRIGVQDHKRRYALEQMLEMILGLDVEFAFEKEEEQGYTLLFGGKSVHIGSVEALSPRWVKNIWGPEEDIMVLYGEGTEADAQDQYSIRGLKCDVAMSAFYMLSRAEEIGAEERHQVDEHGRFKSTYSIASQYGFLDRPIVNEYAEMIVNIFASLGVVLPCNRQGAKMLYTHDVDILTFEPIIKAMAGDILKRHNLLSAIKRLKNLFYDEHDTFDALMTLSEERGQKALFNIMGTHYDYHKSKECNYLGKSAFERMVKKIETRGHEFGFHPGYHTMKDEGQWKKEKEKVEKRLGRQLTEGRQHFLRVSVPKTLEIWEDNGMTKDSSLGYADKTGFRCGTGCLYHPYDFRKECAMRLMEQPLIVMDGTMDKYEQLTEDEKKERIIKYDSLSKRYDMPITLLYHN